MKQAATLQFDLERLPLERRELCERERRLLQEAQEHPTVAFNEAAKLAGLSRSNAYKILNGERKRKA